ncbi:MAG TPA: hypothetical protein ENH31_08280 [Nitrospirae bacterium]|nr:hypothetical protein BMS3Abin10_02103 [bacterium BMS3Abin10]GBE37963.1 hypothetical protein BMS3Bbin08_00562 [bacterium BMS3Bbin08]HDH51362.1 hypothetical protein [Nitrospirota bacterium]HDK82547.1 hypothetical protein [Nitrospirota bacterium]
MSKEKDKKPLCKHINRRSFLKGGALGLASLAMPFGTSDASVWESFFQKHFREMNQDEIRAVIDRLEKEYEEKYDTKFNIKASKPLSGTLFGYGLDISRCIGCRRCVYACVKENNQSMYPQIHWISVLRFEKGHKWVSNLYEYGPSAIEKSVTIGIWAAGALFFTLFLKFAMPVYTGELRFKSPEGSD